MADKSDAAISEKQAFDHAWNWFSLHAGQRMQSFNFFLIATAFLFAAYGSTLDKDPRVAAMIGLCDRWPTSRATFACRSSRTWHDPAPASRPTGPSFVSFNGRRL